MAGLFLLLRHDSDIISVSGKVAARTIYPLPHHPLYFLPGNDHSLVSCMSPPRRSCLCEGRDRVILFGAVSLAPRSEPVLVNTGGMNGGHTGSWDWGGKAGRGAIQVSDEAGVVRPGRRSVPVVPTGSGRGGSL